MTEIDASTPIGSRRPKWHFAAFTALLVLIIALGLLALAEYVARSLEPKEISSFQNQPDATMGWLPKPGNGRLKTGEFDTTVTINSLNMNDREWTPADAKSPSRILALGDSHTFAVGVATNETWPKRAESALFSSPSQGNIMNGGVVGYSLGQYLLRYRMLRDKIRPTVLLVGLSMATDLYDLIPPEHGGFIYGGDADRIFFDIGADGKLLERAYRKTAISAAASAGLKPDPNLKRDQSQSLRDYLGQFALYRRLKRSGLAMKVAMYYQPGGKSLMPAMDTVLKKTLNDEDKYRWRLAELIIDQLSREARDNNTKIAIVNIPYLSQVYDNVWSDSFGGFPDKYDRYLGSKRLSEICARHNIIFIDTTDAFVAASRQRKHWLHWPVDGHPTPEGQQLIADVVVAAMKRDHIIERTPGS